MHGPLEFGVSTVVTTLIVEGKCVRWKKMLCGQWFHWHGFVPQIKRPVLRSRWKAELIRPSWIYFVLFNLILYLLLFLKWLLLLGLDVPSQIVTILFEWYDMHSLAHKCDACYFWMAMMVQTMQSIFNLISCNHNPLVDPPFIYLSKDEKKKSLPLSFKK